MATGRVPPPRADLSLDVPELPIPAPPPLTTDPGTTVALSHRQHSSAPVDPPSTLATPDRYFVQDEAEGLFLYCREAPEVRVKVARGVTFTAAAARKAPEGTIFLDGAAQGGPFLDAERRVFNLDHHEGCVRSFTLSTCEQALVLVLRGLDVKERTWTIHANDPDLDTVIALWVLLNGPHLASTHDPRLRDAVIPLVRIEGILDVHGPERTSLAGLPTPLLDDCLLRIARLRDREVALRRSGGWDTANLVAFTADQLRELDSLLYPPDYFLGFRPVEVVTRLALSDHRVVVVCRAESGIYDAEAELKRLYGKRLGVIALQKDDRTYTLRQVDPFLPDTLDAVYARLNLLDPAVASRAASNRWGGSAEIGGSPRESGTKLSATDIADACRIALRKPTPEERVRAVATAVLAPATILFGCGLLAMAPLVRWLAKFEPTLAALAAELEPDVLLATAGAAVMALLWAAAYGRRWTRVYGLRQLWGADWLFAVPAALIAALAGGVWYDSATGLFGPGRGPAAFDSSAFWLSIAAVVSTALAAELVFRGLAHGLLARSFPVMHEGGRWFLSLPTGLTAVLYAAATPLVRHALGAPIGDLRALLLTVTGGLLFGLAAGVARERSGSSFAPVLLHLAGIATTVAAAFLTAWVVGLG